MKIFKQIDASCRCTVYTKWNDAPLKLYTFYMPNVIATGFIT